MKSSTLITPSGKPADLSIAYALARIGLGTNFLAHGISRIGAIPEFSESLGKMFGKTWLPGPLVTASGFAIPPAELVLGLFLITGVLLRPALIAGMLLMCALTFGMSLLQQWATVSDQLLYMAFIAALYAFARFNGFSIPGLIRASGKHGSPD